MQLRAICAVTRTRRFNLYELRAICIKGGLGIGTAPIAARGLRPAVRAIPGNIASALMDAPVPVPVVFRGRDDRNQTCGLALIAFRRPTGARSPIAYRAQCAGLCGTADRPLICVPGQSCRLFKRRLHACERSIEARSDACDDGDNGNGDAGGDESVFDSGRADFVAKKMQNRSRHRGLLWLTSRSREHVTIKRFAEVNSKRAS
jgi:hypothetical protein